MLLRSRRVVRARSALLLALCLHTACRAGTEPPFPSDAVPLDPPPAYRLWWSIVEGCSGVTRDFDAVRFYEEPDHATVTAGSETANAYWFSSGDRIVVGGLNEFDGPVLRHEMLHALLGTSAGGHGHPHEYFVRRCGGIVHCVSTCLTDDGPLPVPDPAAPVVSPNVLDVRVSVQPTPFDPAQYGGWMAVLVTARNPLPHAVWVSLPAQLGGPDTFGFAIDGSAVDATAADAMSVPFQAGELQRQLFDVHVAPGLVDLAPGSYDLRGFFASDTSGSQPLIVLGAH